LLKIIKKERKENDEYNKNGIQNGKI